MRTGIAPLVLGLLAIPTVILGGLGLAVATGTLQAPSAGLVDMGEWGNVTNDSIPVHTTVWVDNPNPVGLTVSTFTLEYGLDLQGIRLAEGTLEELPLEPGNSTTTVTTDVITANLPAWWVTHLQAGETSRASLDLRFRSGLLPFKAPIDPPDIGRTIQTDITGRMEDALNAIEGTYNGPTVTILGFQEQPQIEVREITASWGEITRNTTTTDVAVTVYNPNAYPIPTPTFTGDITLNDITMSRWDASQTDSLADTQIPAGESREVPFEIDLDNDKIDDWLHSHVRNGERTSGTITVSLLFEIGGTRFTVPQDGMTCRFDIQTALLMDEQRQQTEIHGCTGPTDGTAGTDGQDDGSSGGNDDGSTNTTEDDGSTFDDLL